MPHTMHVISHTHWDREWYLTFQQFRMRLVDLMDHLLEILDKDPEFRHFNLDGQTIVLEDYLQIRPEKRGVIEKHVREGRILIGPWYQLNDEFLVSGESTVRSLLIGHRIAAEYGDVMKVGYLPDQFGNISQMPQILNGFGIDNAIFGRGLQLSDGRKMEFYWESPDGSRVLASLMAYWYNNAQRFPADTDEAVRYTHQIRDTLGPISHVDHLLLMNGVDHLEAQPDVGEIIARVNSRLNGDRLVHSTLPTYVDSVRKATASCSLDTIAGELREDRMGSVLAGTLSSRMYLKQANERSQTALEKYAEPAASFAATLGEEYPQGFLDYAWKLLMQNHPHDSICGCSVDQVHREMAPRFEQVEQVAGELTTRALDAIASRVKTDGESLFVFNPLNWVRTDKVRATIDFQIGQPTRLRPEIDPAMRVQSLRILDEQGAEVPMAVISAEVTGKQLLRPDELPFGVMIKRFVVEFLAEDMPPCGYRVYRIEKAGHDPRPTQELAADFYWDNAIGNEFLRLSLQAGAVCIDNVTNTEDNLVGGMHSGLNTFEDTGDVGDEYIHLRPTSNVVVTSLGSNPRVSMVDSSPVSATLKLETSLTVPAEADGAKSARSEATVECPITSYFTVTRGVPRVDVVTEIENGARDHRLRVLFPSGIEADTSSADGQFDVVERQIGIPAEWGPTASPFFPQQRWVDVSDGQRGLCIINKGLPEYEVYDDGPRTIALTLLRCVGRISGGHDAPGADLTPEAQCIGHHTFEYSIYPHAGKWEDARVWMQALQHNMPMLAIQTGAHDGGLPPQMSFLETSHPKLILSAVKKAQDSDMMVVRVYNPTAQPIADAWIRLRGARSAKLLSLNEEVTGEVPFGEEVARLDVGAKKIVTIGFEVSG